MKELWRGRGIVPSGPIAKGDNHFDAIAAAARLQPEGGAASGSRRPATRARRSSSRPPWPTSRRTSRCPRPSRPCGRTWASTSRSRSIEYSVRAQKNREKSFKGVWWSDPTSTLGDPDGMMWRLLGPGGPQDYWRDAKFDELGNAARFSRGREVPRRGLQGDDQDLPREPARGSPSSSPTRTTGSRSTWSGRRTRTSSSRSAASTSSSAARRVRAPHPALSPSGERAGTRGVRHARVPSRSSATALFRALDRALARLHRRLRRHAPVRRSRCRCSCPPDAPHSEIMRRARASWASTGRCPVQYAVFLGNLAPRRLRPLDPLPRARLQRGARLPAGHARARADRLRARRARRGAHRAPLRHAAQHPGRSRGDGPGPDRPVGAHVLPRHPLHPAAVAQGRSLPDLGPRRLAQPRAARADPGRLHHGLDRPAHPLGGARGAARRLHPHRAGQGRGGDAGWWPSTRSRTRRSRS